MIVRSFAAYVAVTLSITTMSAVAKFEQHPSPSGGYWREYTYKPLQSKKSVTSASSKPSRRPVANPGPGREFAISIPMPIPIVVPVPASSFSEAVNYSSGKSSRSRSRESSHDDDEDKPVIKSYQTLGDAPVYRSKHILKPAKRKYSLKTHGRKNTPDKYNDADEKYDNDDDGRDERDERKDRRSEKRKNSNRFDRNEEKYERYDNREPARDHKRNHGDRDREQKGFARGASNYYDKWYGSSDRVSQTEAEKKIVARPKKHRNTPNWANTSQVNSIQDILATAKRNAGGR